MAYGPKNPVPPIEAPREGKAGEAPAATPAAATKAPEGARQPVLTASAEKRDALKAHPFLKRFPEFVKMIETRNKWDFAGFDIGIPELKENPVWKAFQERLQARLRNEASNLPAHIEDQFLNEWLNCVFERSAGIIAGYDDSPGVMEISAIEKHLEEIFSEKAEPGPFLKWFERKHPEKFDVLNKNIEEAKKGLSGGIGAALALLTETKKKVPPELAALPLVAMELEKRLKSASTRQEMDTIAAEIGAYNDTVSRGITVAEALRLAETQGAKFTRVREALGERIAAAKEKLSKAKTVAEIEEAGRLVAGIENWERLETAMASAEIPETNKPTVEDMKKPEFDPQNAASSLEGIKGQRAAEIASLPTGEEGLLGWLAAKINAPLPLIGKLLPEKLRYAILGFIATIAMALPKSWRRNGMFSISSSTLEYVGKATGKQEVIIAARTEAIAEKAFLKAGVSKELSQKLLDMSVAQFDQTPPQSLTKDGNEMAALLRVKRSLRQNGVGADDKTALAIAVGSSENFKMEEGPAAPAQQTAAPEQTPETPAQKVDKLLQGELALTPDELAKTRGLSAVKMAKGEIAKPEGFDPERWTKLQRLLQKNKAQDRTDSGLTIVSFFQSKFEKSEAVDT